MITGHRPQKLGGFKDNPTKKGVLAALKNILDRATRDNKEVVLISGMALGVDQWWAELGIARNLPVHAYVPFEGQESRWPQASRQKYTDLLQQCESIRIVCPGHYSAQKMQERNEAMVDAADVCIAIWDGSSGGTSNCVAYIRQQEKPLLWVSPLSWGEERERWKIEK
jgi:uncharacterized phage-like protein YoqJ